MTIKLESTSRNFKLTILKTPTWAEDKEKVKKIPGRTPIYKYDKTLQIDKFDHWEISHKEVRHLVENWDQDQIIASPEARAVLEAYSLLSEPIENLSRIEGDLPCRRQPYEHQIPYIRMAPTKSRIILSFQQGVGKTYTSLVRAKLLGFKNLLIVCPKQTLTGWKTELRSSIDEDEPFLYRGSGEKRKKMRETFAEEMPRIVITNYEMVREIANFTIWDSMIIDEAHLVANPSTDRFKDIERLVKHNPGKLQLLTGTPINNHVPDLWALVHLVSPEIAGSFNAWKARYVKVLATMKKRLRNGRIIEIPIKTMNQNMDELHERIKPIMVRVSREGLVSFKDTFETLVVETTPRQKQLYQAIKDQILLDLETGVLETRNALTEMLRLLQVGESPININPKWKDSGKYDYCKEAIKAREGKILIWSRFKPLLYQLYEDFKDKAVMYNGDMSDSMKILSIWAVQGVSDETDAAEFQRLKKLNPDFPFEPGEAEILFATIDGRSGVGINLPAIREQIFTSVHMNPQVIFQAADRIKRINQEAEEVKTTFLVSEGTFELDLLDRLFKRYDDNINILDGKSSISSSLVQEMIRILKDA